MRKANENASGEKLAIDTLITADDNREMFNLIARRYDLMNALLSFGLDRYWRRHAVAAVEPCDGKEYLDIGCGTGDMALEILRQAPASSVICVDPAQKMLDVGLQKVSDAGLSDSVSLILGDATKLTFSDSTFAGIVTAFCVRNITDRAKALSEMHRVLEPGGTVAILELSIPQNRVIRAGHWCYNHWCVPFIGRLIAGRETAYKYLVDSVEDFLQPDMLLSLMEEAGFKNVEHIPLNFGIVTIYIGHAE